jgi:hypothetical protein
VQILEAAGGCFQQQEIKEEFWSTAERVGAGEQAAGSRQQVQGLEAAGNRLEVQWLEAADTRQEVQ